jgi:hypothetical protein
MRYSTCAVMLLLAGYGSAAADMRPLNDEQLNTITAGSADVAHAAGGFAVANGSAATVDESNVLTLETEAQAGARAVNLVNTADALVAQATNIWDGRFQAGGAGDTTVDQSNLVVQTQATRSAALAGYQRGVDETTNDTLNTTTSNLDTIDLVSDVSVDTNHQILGQSVNVGLGVGVAGRVGIELDAASIDVGLDVESRLETSVGVNGTINLPKPFGAMEADGQLDSEIVNGGSVHLNVDTPPVSIDAIGSVCYTKLGLCEATADDNSTYQTNSTHDETHAREVQGAVTLAGVGAEYIVIDESNLQLTTGHSLTLASGAQSNVTALNVVNAVGSLVANGVNVSRTVVESGAVMPPVLVQRNVVIQGF